MTWKIDIKQGGKRHSNGLKKLMKNDSKKLIYIFVHIAIEGKECGEQEVFYFKIH